MAALASLMQKSVALMRQSYSLQQQFQDAEKESDIRDIQGCDIESNVKRLKHIDIC